MKKVILAASVCLFFASANAQTTAPSSTPAMVQENKNAPEMKFDVEEYNFGTIKQGEHVTYDFKFSNSGKEPLIISSAQGSCGCTVPQWPKEPVAKGGNGFFCTVFMHNWICYENDTSRLACNCTS